MWKTCKICVLSSAHCIFLETKYPKCAYSWKLLIFTRFDWRFFVACSFMLRHLNYRKKPRKKWSKKEKIECKCLLSFWRQIYRFWRIKSILQHFPLWALSIKTLIAWNGCELADNLWLQKNPCDHLYTLDFWCTGGCTPHPPGRTSCTAGRTLRTPGVLHVRPYTLRTPGRTPCTPGCFRGVRYCEGCFRP